MRADKSEVATAYLHRSAATVVRVAEVLGLPEEQWYRYRDIAAGALDAWRREFLRPDGTLAVQTQASHVRALAFGLVPEELRPQVAARLAELVGLADGHLTTGFLSTPYLLPVLADHGYLDIAYQLLLQDTPPSWLTMVDRGATTVWEEWEGVDGHGVPHASLNHYSKGAVAAFLHRYVAGLRPAAPGYRTVEVRPRPGGGITSATARHISPFGPIEVSWSLAAGRWSSTCWSRRAPRRPSPCPASRPSPRAPAATAGPPRRRAAEGFMIVSGFGRYLSLTAHDHEAAGERARRGCWRVGRMVGS